MAQDVTFSPSRPSIASAAAANAPLYSFIEIWMDNNLVGGSLISISRPVRSAAALALRVLRGENADNIATLEIDPTHQPGRLAAASSLGNPREPHSCRNRHSLS